MMATDSVCTSRIFRFSSLKPLMGGLLMLFILQRPAHAEMWGYMDGQGVAHFPAQRAGNKIPNYLETRNYVDTVMQLYNHLKPYGRMTTPGARVHVEMMGGPVTLAEQD